MSTTTENSDSTFYLSPFCCICLETSSLYRLDSNNSDNISFTFKLQFCFPEKEKKQDNSVRRYICDKCTLMLNLTFKFKQLYYQNTVVSDQYKNEFKKFHKNKYKSISVSLQDVKPFLSPENTVRVKDYDPAEGAVEITDDIEMTEDVMQDKFNQIINTKEFLGFTPENLECIVCKLFKKNNYNIPDDILSKIPADEDDIPKKKFVCPICNRLYSSLNSLQNHKYFHKERKYSCEFCPKRYIRFDNYQQHLKNHNLQLSCHICPQGQKCVKCNKIVVHLSRHRCQRVAIATMTCQRCQEVITNGDQHVCVPTN